MSGVILHGYQTDQDARKIIQSSDALICTSHEEGLGLPLLEAQFAGLPVIAPNQPVFREVLDKSGIFIDPSNPRAAAETIVGCFTADGWRMAHIARGTTNLQRWNKAAASDRDRVIELLRGLTIKSGHRRRRLHFANLGRARSQH